MQHPKHLTFLSIRRVDVTTGAISGAVEGAKAIGIGVEDAAEWAATGALEAAEAICEKAVHAVTDVAAGGVGGVKNILKGKSETQ